MKKIQFGAIMQGIHQRCKSISFFSIVRPPIILNLGPPQALGHGLRAAGTHRHICRRRHSAGFGGRVHPRSHGQDANLPGIQFSALRLSTINKPEENRTLLTAQPLQRRQGIVLLDHGVSAHQAAEFHQRMVCDRQNRCYQFYPTHSHGTRIRRFHTEIGIHLPIEDWAAPVAKTVGCTGEIFRVASKAYGTPKSSSKYADLKNLDGKLKLYSKLAQ